MFALKTLSLATAASVCVLLLSGGAGAAQTGVGVVGETPQRRCCVCKAVVVGGKILQTCPCGPGNNGGTHCQTAGAECITVGEC
jgi:hypothetical protein